MIINQVNIKACTLKYPKAKTQIVQKEISSNWTWTLQNGNMDKTWHIVTVKVIKNKVFLKI